MLLRAVAGSRLYGTHRPDSDFDYYEVHDRIRARQTIVGSQDVTRMPLSQWLLLCEKGTHQALDAMWAPPDYCEVDRLTSFRTGYRVDPYRVARQLERTAFAMSPDNKHFHRLLFCSMQVRERGWYDPTEWGRGG